MPIWRVDVMSQIKRFLCALTVFSCISVSAHAHHGTAINYDVSKQIVVQAVVTRFRYAQPHLQIFLDVKDEQGNIVKWACEYVPNIPTLIREGWSKKRMKQMLPVGTELEVTMSPSRSGKPVGLVLKMVNKDGEVVGMAFDKTDSPKEE
jgi:hypothetical protein